MTDDTPPLHPKQRDYLQAASTLVVTVESPREFAESVADSIDALDAGEAVGEPPTLSFVSYDDLLDVFTPRVLELVEAVRREEPESINEAARVVERDVKNVHGELTELARLGVIYFEEEGTRKRPVVWFDELVISLPFEPEATEPADAAP